MKTKKRTPRPLTAILKYSPTKVDQGRVRRAYLRWRRENGLADRCDNEACWFFTQALIWNAKPLRPVLDHREGNRYDNSPRSLWLLCPDCDSQLPTRGGANRGRVQDLTDDGYVLVNRKDGSRIVAATGRAGGKSSASARAGTDTGDTPPIIGLQPTAARASIWCRRG